MVETSEQTPPGPHPGAVSPHPAGTTGERMAKGAMWMILARILDRSLGLVSTVILARLLLPADFGLVAMATAVVAMLELLGAFGFDVALIQNPSAGRREYDTAWTFNIMLGAGIALALLAVAEPAARFYGDPRLLPVIACLAGAAFIQGFENVGTVAFRKKLHFQKEFKLLFAKRLATFAVTIPLAFALQSYWALVAGIVVGRVASVILTYLVQDYRPRLSLAAPGALFHFGKWLVLNNLLQFVSTRAADVLVGKVAGPRELGLFNVSYEISNLPTSELIAPINRAIYPGYALNAVDAPSLKRSYLDVMSLIAGLAIPAGVGIAAVADVLVPLALGPNWVDATPAIVALSFYGILLALKSNNHYVYLAMGRPRIATLLGCIQIVILLPLVVVGSARAGAYGVALGYVIAQALFTPISLAILQRVLRLRVMEQVRVFYRPVIAGAIMFGGVRMMSYELQGLGTDPGALLARLLGCVTTGVLLYAAVSYGLWSAAGKPYGAESLALDFVRSRLLARAVRRPPRRAAGRHEE